jgi:hypothetical protein
LVARSSRFTLPTLIWIGSWSILGHFGSSGPRAEAAEGLLVFGHGSVPKQAQKANVGALAATGAQDLARSSPTQTVGLLGPQTARLQEASEALDTRTTLANVQWSLANGGVII